MGQRWPWNEAASDLLKVISMRSGRVRLSRFSRKLRKLRMVRIGVLLILANLVGEVKHVWNMHTSVLMRRTAGVASMSVSL